MYLPSAALLLSAVIGAAAIPASAPASTPTTFVVSPSTPTATASASTSHCYLHVTAHAGDSCASIAAVFNIDIATFRRMNPGIDCSHLKGEYCVADGSVASSSSPPAPSRPPSSPSAPTPHQSPITPACRSWHLVARGDTCEHIEQALGISDADFRSWNGFLDEDCTNLWLDYYCCIGV
ncbi:hypothetical protein Sste5346_007840 [Sporothrix stenoceras]|uniref:LysM domain-containing protein n=1 Tax=Sporothrix stenoceras TaxID=5173 RepID=A0ABR3YTI2_9PEZI